MARKEKGKENKMDARKNNEKRNYFIEECFNFSDSERNAFARCCGMSVLKAPIDVLILFWGMNSNQFISETPIWSEEIEAKFFIACLISKYRKNSAKGANKILIQNELRKMYDFKNKPCARNVQIKAMLTTPLDRTGQLCYRINSLIELMSKDVQENLDFERLYMDIRYWNQPISGTSFKRNGAKYVWAYQIVKNTEDTNYNNEEIQE
jgi:hypothetical protein